MTHLLMFQDNKEVDSSDNERVEKTIVFESSSSSSSTSSSSESDSGALKMAKKKKLSQKSPKKSKSISYAALSQAVKELPLKKQVGVIKMLIESSKKTKTTKRK